MNTSFDRAKEIFLDALEIAPADDRQVFLDSACGDDTDLREEVEGLLGHHERIGSFLATVPRDPNATAGLDVGAVEAPGALVGPYRLLERVGEGGMGQVFVAEQTEPVRRKVALKVIKPGMDTREVVARFEAERQALALMDHPNIARVLDGGSTPSGRPYFVMELVRGVSITEYCDRNHLTVRARLELFVQVCQAIQHAHQKGIIHRDIKPSNVLVTEHDGRPVAKVIDFGVAKAVGAQLSDKTIYTRAMQLLGTPLYMSPEQAGASGQDIDTRTDVYSLGVLLYELLTGTTPFDRDRFRTAGYDELRRIIREEEPARPSSRLSTLHAAATTVSANRATDPRRLTRIVRGELDWVVMKSLEKDRNRRYESAAAFAADVQRYLADEPVQACPPSAAYRLRKFVRRNKVALVTSAVIAVAVVAAAGTVGWTLHERRERERSAEDARVARQRQTASQIEGALLDGEELLRQKKRREARAAIQMGLELMTEGDHTAQRERAEALLTDLALAQTLDAIRLEHAANMNTGFNNEQSNEKYARAFRDYGLDIDSYRPEEAARRILARPIRDEMREALDDWAVARRGLMLSREARWKAVRWQHLIAVARAADDNPTRNRVRDVLASNDRKAVRDLATAMIDHEDRSDLLPAALAVFFAEALGEAGANEAGVALMVRAWERNPNDFWLNYNLGVMYFRSGQPEKAIRFYTAALALRPDTNLVYLNLGSALCAIGDREGGLAAFRRVLAIAPDFAEGHNNLGNHLGEAGDLLGALHHHRRAVELQRDNPVFHMSLGHTLADLADLDATFARISLPHARLPRVVLPLARQEEALASFNRSLELRPGWSVVHYNRGNLLATMGRLKQAIADYQAAVAGDPSFVLAYLRLGDTLYENRQLPEAAEVYRQAIAVYARPPERRSFTGNYHAISRRVRPAEAIYSLGRVLNKQGKLPEAEDAFRQAAIVCENTVGFPAIEILNDQADSYHALGKALFQRGKYADAETAFRKAIAAGLLAGGVPATEDQARHMQHDLGRAYDSLSRALAKLGKDEEDALRQAIRNLPDSEAAEVSQHLGVVLGRQHRYSDAEAAFRKALALGRRSAELYQDLGLALASQGKSQEAARHFQAALEIDPNHALAAFFLGVALQQAGEFDTALAWLKKAYQRLPPAHPARAQAANYIRNCNNLIALAERMPAVEKGEYRFESAEERVNMARVFALKKRYEVAARLYKEGFAEEPELAEDWQLGARYAAAQAAAQAGGDWRKQALAWLRADLALSRRLLRDEPRTAPAIIKRLALWQEEPALAGVREPDALAKLPLAERQAFAELWTEVEMLQIRKKRETALKLEEDRAVADARAAAESPTATGKDLFQAAAVYARAAREAQGDAELAEGRAARAMELLRQSLKKGYTDLLVLETDPRFDVLRHREDFLNLVKKVEERIRREPGAADTYVKLGKLLNGQRRFEDAIVACDKATIINPGLAEAYLTIGDAREMMGQLPAAIEAYREAVRLDGNHAFAHANLGFALARQGDAFKSVSALERAIELRPNEVVFHKYLGDVLRGRGDLDRAEAVYRKAIDLQQAPAAFADLGLLLIEQGRVGDATKAFRDAIERDRNYAVAYRHLGYALMLMGEYEKDKIELIRSRDLTPPNLRQPVHQLLAHCDRLNSLAKRLPALLDGKDKPADAAERAAFAEVCLARGHYNASVKLYAEALRERPQLATAHRGDAARAAIMAGCSPPLAFGILNHQRPVWREQARDWLMEEMKSWEGLVQNPQGRNRVLKTLLVWQRHPDFAAVRDKDELAKLPKDEQARWRKFWSDVDAVLARVKPKPKKEEL